MFIQLPFIRLVIFQKILKRNLLVQLGKVPDHVPLAVHCLTEGPERMYPSTQE